MVYYPAQNAQGRLISLKKVRRHKKAVTLGISNAQVEAINNKIKLTVRMGYGFRNIDNLFALVMLRCSNLPIMLPERA